MALLLATVTSTYHLGGELAVSWPQGSARPLHDFAWTWLAQFLVSSLMLGLIDRGYHRVPAGPPWRHAGLGLLVLACTGGGAFVQVLLFHGYRPAPYSDARWFDFLASTLVLACLLVAAHAFAQRSRVVAGALHDSQLSQLGLARELDVARLQLLQAQVEPHFLFNALANVRRLLRTEPESARTLLDDLRRYLEEALPALRDEHTTLGRECELVRAYLAVHQVRMGSRLHAELDIPPALALRSVPPMVLLTLVENALKHGLQPLVGGGMVRVAAQAAGARLTLTVADTGRGMGNASGGGTGLANVRARLRSIYGAAASLSLAVNEPQGVIATIVLPELPDQPQLPTSRPA
jgi:hypothetical protein